MMAHLIFYGLSYLQGFINIILLRPFQPDWLVNSQAAYCFKNIAYPYVTNHGYDFHLLQKQFKF